MQIGLSDADAELDRLEAQPAQHGIIKTAVVGNILTSTQAGVVLGQPLPSGCQVRSVNILSRSICLNQGAYEEVVSINDAAGVKHQVTWVGSIPLPMLTPLRRHPRLLDFPEVSLFVREANIDAIHNPPLMEGIDYVRRNTELSIPLLISAIAHPEIPWDHFEERLEMENGLGLPKEYLSKVFQAISPATQPSQPAPSSTYSWLDSLPPAAQEAFKSGYPAGVFSFRGTYVATTDQEFTESVAQRQGTVSRLGHCNGQVQDRRSDSAFRARLIRSRLPRRSAWPPLGFPWGGRWSPKSI